MNSLIHEEMLATMSKMEYLQPVTWTSCDRSQKKFYAELCIKNKFITPRHGDLIYWLEPKFVVLFWHEVEGIIFPFEEIDPFGSVPPCFRVGHGPGEFPPNHWFGLMKHNEMIFFSKDFLAKIIKTLQKIDDYTWMTTVVFNNTVYSVRSNNDYPGDIGSYDGNSIYAGLMSV